MNDQELKQMKEDVKEQIKEGSILSTLIPIIRKAIPSLIASEIVGIQPITSPFGGIITNRDRFVRAFGVKCDNPPTSGNIFNMKVKYKP